MKRRKRPIRGVVANHRRQLLVRLEAQGYSTAAMARRLNVTSRCIRYMIASPEYQQLATAFWQAMLGGIDRDWRRVLSLIPRTLVRQLVHHDWRTRDAALDKIIRIYGPELAQWIKRAVGDSTRPVSQPSEVIPEEAMTEEQRGMARQLMQSMRLSRKALPGVAARITSIHETHSNGQPMV